MASASTTRTGAAGSGETTSSARVSHVVVAAEDIVDIRRAQQQNVWASTPSGNITLGEHYACGAVYLYFKVLGTNRFVGVAKMASPPNLPPREKLWSSGAHANTLALEWIEKVDGIGVVIPKATDSEKEIGRMRCPREIGDTQCLPLKYGRESMRLFIQYRPAVDLQGSALLREAAEAAGLSNRLDMTSYFERTPTPTRHAAARRRRTSGSAAAAAASKRPEHYTVRPDKASITSFFKPDSPTATGNPLSKPGTLPKPEFVSGTLTGFLSELYE